MKRQRLLVGSAASIVWPAIVVLIPMGITFAAARVYAEGAPAVDCAHPSAIACADAAIGALCSPGYYTGKQGLCRNNGGCYEGNASTDKNSLVCFDEQFCASIPVDDCTGKADGTACNGGQGTCAITGGCVEVDAGVGVAGVVHGCVVDAGPGLGVPPDPACGDVRQLIPCQGKNMNDSCRYYEREGTCWETNYLACPWPADAGPRSYLICHVSDGTGSSSSSGDDSGCSTSSSSTSLPLLGGPLALGILLALRRKRTRRAKMES